MRVVTIDVPHLGNRTHLVHDDRVAVAIDPPRDVTAIEEAAAGAGVDIVAVAETHIHNDYVSGGLPLAKRHGAEYVVAADETVDFARLGVHDNETLAFGDLELRAIATPGHTPLHLSYLATDRRTTGTGTGTGTGTEPDSHQDRPGALFSGGSLLHGTVGRTDLIDPSLTLPLSRAQWLSARRLGALPARTALHPTHGFGSFCASAQTPAERGTVTIGDQRGHNPALTLPHEAFVTQLLRGLGPVPSHYAHMAPRNRAGAWDPLPDHRLAAPAVDEALARGAHVIDVRSSADYAAGHLPGSLSVPAGKQCAVYAGWVTPWGAELVVVADSEDDLDQLVAELGSIGIEKVGTAVLDRSTTAGWTGLRRTDWAGFLAQPPAPGTVLVDVRRLDEWCTGHLAGSRNIPVHELPHRLEEIPPGEVWVHCAAGYRAAIAAGLLDRAGYDVVLVDDDFDRVAELGIPLLRGRSAA